MSSTGSAMLGAALELAARGWSVLPMEARGKRPLVAWRGLQERAAAPAELEAWFAEHPEANLGVVTGVVSRWNT